MYVHFPHIHQEKHAIFDKSERKLVNALDEMRSLWQEFVRRKDTDATVSIYSNLIVWHCHYTPQVQWPYG